MLVTLLLFLILLAGIVFGPMLAGHQGYVLIQTSQYEIETSVTALIVTVIVLYAAIRGVEWFLRHLLRSGSVTLRWFRFRKRSRARQQTQDALLKLVEGDYQQAEKLLTRNAPYAEQPVVNYLLAAEAAKNSGAMERSEHYLQQASQLNQLDSLPVAIAQVRLLLQQGNLQEARQCVEQLLSKAPRHPEVLRLAKQTYLDSHNAGDLLEILPTLHKLHLYDEQQLSDLEQQAYIDLMQDAMADGASGLNRWWRQQPRRIRRYIPLQVELVQRLFACQDSVSAEQLLKKSLKKQPDPRLLTVISRYMTAPSPELEKRLQRLSKRGNSAELDAALGKLLSNREAWQPAYDALQASVKQQSDSHNYALLADVLDKLQRHNEANKIRKMLAQQTVGEN
ncbi:MAG: heme biosynthesis HemY N-terminal domain-containing protein [Enterobacteriaceae bacterium]